MTPSWILAPPGMLENFANFFSMSQGKRAPVCRKILSKDKNLSVVHQAVSCNNTIARDLFMLHTEIGTAVHLEAIELNKRPFIQKSVDPFTGGEFSGIVLLFDPIGTTAFHCFLILFLEFFQYLF